MNIGLINEYFPPFVLGGAEWSTYYLGKALALKGHKVIVITPDYGAKSYEEMDGMKVYRFPFTKFKPLFHFSLALNVIKFARYENIDILHIQNSGSVIGGALASFCLRKPFLTTVRDYMYLCTAGLVCLNKGKEMPERCSIAAYIKCLLLFQRSFYGTITALKSIKHLADGLFLKIELYFKNICLKKSHKIIMVSEYLKNIYCKYKRDLSKKLEVIYNIPPREDTVSLSESEGASMRRKYSISDNAKIVLFCGRITPAKGLGLIKNYIQLVSKEMDNTIFILAGKNIKTLNLGSNVRITGFIPHGELMQLMQISDVVIIPSIWGEPLSRVALEAMSLAKPIVGTSVGGTPEIITDGVNGFLVDKDDYLALSEKVAKLLKEESLRREFGANGYKILGERFSPDLLINRTLQIYKDALSSKRVKVA